MIGMRACTVAVSIVLASFLVALSAAPAYALWTIRTVVNKTDQIVSVSIPVYAGATKTSQNMVVTGSLVVAIPGHGVVSFQDKGHNTLCRHPYWGVAITYNAQQWGFFYDGAGTIDMTINADGSLTFVAGPGGQVVNGSGSPKCSVP